MGNEGDGITVDFGTAFGLPSTIDPAHVTLSDGANTGNPSDAVTSGGKVTLYVTDLNPDTATNYIANNETVTITFQQRAGITNPTKAGDLLNQS